MVDYFGDRPFTYQLGFPYRKDGAWNYSLTQHLARVRKDTALPTTWSTALPAQQAMFMDVMISAYIVANWQKAIASRLPAPPVSVVGSGTTFVVFGGTNA